MLDTNLFLTLTLIALVLLWIFFRNKLETPVLCVIGIHKEGRRFLQRDKLSFLTTRFSRCMRCSKTIHAMMKFDNFDTWRPYDQAVIACKIAEIAQDQALDVMVVDFLSNDCVNRLRSFTSTSLIS